MGIVLLDDLKPGMVLAADVRDGSGRMLLPGGAEVEEKHLKIFRSWGVGQVDVADGETPASEEELPPEVLDAARAHVDALFGAAGKGEAAGEMRRLGAKRLALRMYNEGYAPPPPWGGETDVPAPEVPERTEPADPAALVADVELASLPTIFAKLVEAINNPRSSAASIAEVVGKDTSLSARLLKVVNSPFYGFPSRIDTISRAVTIIGTKQLTTLAVGICAMDVFQGVPEDVVDMRTFWQHSLGAGLLARLLAANCDVANTERLFVCGLLHDIGHLLLYTYRTKQAVAAVALGRAEGVPLFEAERRILGFDHSRLGAELLRLWKLPVTIENAVAHHHEPSKSHDPREAAIVAVANTMAYALDMGGSGETRMPPVPRHVLKLAEMPLGALGQAAAQADTQFKALTGAILSR